MSFSVRTTAADSVEEFVAYQIANAQIRSYPYPHFYVHQVFPDDYYRHLLSRIPPLEIMKPLLEGGTVGPVDGNFGEPQRSHENSKIRSGSEARYICDLATIEEHEDLSGQEHFWRDLSQWILGESFAHLLMHRFAHGIQERFGPKAVLRTETEARFVRDFTRYAIGPHTDTPRKLVSLLFYLPHDEGIQHTGTSIYRPKDRSFQCEGTKWHKFERFNKVATMPFLPNSLFAFLKTDTSFHGVEEIADENIERNVLLYNIYVNKVVTKKETAVKKSWKFWSRKPS